MFNIIVAVVLGIILGVAATVFLYCCIIPKRFDGTFKNKFFQIVHDYFNFKTLYIEIALKFIFVVATVLVICIGFFLLFAKSFGTSTFLMGLSTMIFGPVALRLTYEAIMMFVMLVRNTIEINNKLSNQSANKFEVVEVTNETQNPMQ